MPQVTIVNRTTRILNVAFAQVCPLHHTNAVMPEQEVVKSVGPVWFTIECKTDTGANRYSLTESAKSIALICTASLSVATVVFATAVPGVAAGVVGSGGMGALYAFQAATKLAPMLWPAAIKQVCKDNGLDDTTTAKIIQNVSAAAASATTYAEQHHGGPISFPGDDQENIVDTARRKLDGAVKALGAFGISSKLLDPTGSWLNSEDSDKTKETPDLVKRPAPPQSKPAAPSAAPAPTRPALPSSGSSSSSNGSGKRPMPSFLKPSPGKQQPQPPQPPQAPVGKGKQPPPNKVTDMTVQPYTPPEYNQSDRESRWKPSSKAKVFTATNPAAIPPTNYPSARPRTRSMSQSMSRPVLQPSSKYPSQSNSSQYPVQSSSHSRSQSSSHHSSQSSSQYPSQSVSQKSKKSFDDWAQITLKEINEARAAENLPPLKDKSQVKSADVSRLGTFLIAQEALRRKGQKIVAPLKQITNGSTSGKSNTNQPINNLPNNSVSNKPTTNSKSFFSNKKPATLAVAKKGWVPEYCEMRVYGVFMGFSEKKFSIREGEGSFILWDEIKDVQVK